jgi:hypothetical protein
LNITLKDPKDQSSVVIISLRVFERLIIY